jgi:hypothetical protein
MPQRKYTISAIERYPGTLVVLLPAISDGFVPTSSYIVRYYPRLACVLRVALCISGKDGCQEW